MAEDTSGTVHDNSTLEDPPNLRRLREATIRRKSLRHKSEAVGTRTRDLRIKSPLLYRLSYCLVNQS